MFQVHYISSGSVGEQMSQDFESWSDLCQLFLKLNQKTVDPLLLGNFVKLYPRLGCVIFLLMSTLKFS